MYPWYLKSEHKIGAFCSLYVYQQSQLIDPPMASFLTSLGNTRTILSRKLILLLILLLVLLPIVLSQSATDIVIVGGGTAGCALAARLCALRPEYEIIVLERGGPRNATQAFPAESPRQFWNALDKPYIAELVPTLKSKHTNDRDHVAVIGDTLGGTSALNGRQWTIPLRPTIDSWQIDNLTCDSARLYYKRAFNTVGFAAQKHPFRSSYIDAYLRAAKKSGFQQNDDPFDDRSQRTMFENLLAIDKDGHNINSCDAYLTPAMAGVCASNLKLMQSVTVTKIILRRENEQHVAEGVEYVGVDDEGTCTAKQNIQARVGVIVSAGPFGSPKLLQLSGLGPRQVLQRAGVPLAVNLPTGEKTQARPLVVVNSQYATELEPANNSSLYNSPEQMQAWLRREHSIFGKSPHIANGRVGKHAYVSAASSFSGAHLDQKWIWSACFINPKSVGHLRITSSDALEPPQVNFAFLHDPDDMKRFLDCLPKLVRLHESFAEDYGLQLVLPSDGNITEQFVRDNVIWTGHYVGGCGVGRVVDERLAVKQTARLRVVDTSVLKTIPTSSGPMASVYMLAEYAAEMIATDW